MDASGGHGAGSRTKDTQQQQHPVMSRAVTAALLAVGGVESNPGPHSEPASPSFTWATHPDTRWQSLELQDGKDGGQALQTYEPSVLATPEGTIRRVGNTTCVQVAIPGSAATSPDGKLSRTFSCEVIQFTGQNSLTTTRTTITRGGVTKPVPDAVDGPEQLPPSDDQTKKIESLEKEVEQLKTQLLSLEVEHNFLTTPSTTTTLGGVNKPVYEPLVGQVYVPHSDAVDGPERSPSSEDQEKKIESLEKEVKRLDTNLHFQEVENKYLQDKLTEVSKELTVWTEEKTTYVNRINVFEKQLQELNDSKAQLYKELNEAVNTSPVLYIPPPIIPVKKCNDESHARQINDLSARVTALLEEERLLHEKIDAHERDGEAWGKIYQELKEDNEKYVDEITKLKSKFDKEREEHCKVTRDLEKSVEQLRNEISTLIKTLVGFNVGDGNNNKIPEHEIEFYEQQIAFLKERNEELESLMKQEKQNGEKRYEDMKEIYRKEKIENENYLKVIEEMRRKYEVHFRATEELEEQLKREKHRGDVLGNKLKCEEEAADKLEKELTTSDLEIQKLRKEFDVLKEKLRDSDSDSILVGKLTQLRQELAEEKARNLELVQNWDNYKTHYDKKLQDWQYWKIENVKEKGVLESALIVKENEMKKLKEKCDKLELALREERGKLENEVKTIIFWKHEYEKVKETTKDLEIRLIKEKGENPNMLEKIKWLEYQVEKEKIDKVKQNSKLRRLENQLQDSINQLVITEDALNKERDNSKRIDDELKKIRKSVDDAKKRNDQNENKLMLDAAQIEEGRKLREAHVKKINELQAQVKNLKEGKEKLQDSLKAKQINWNKAMKDLTDEKDKMQNELTVANWQLAEAKIKKGKGCF